MSETNSHLAVEKRQEIALIKLNNPEMHNAITMSMVEGIEKALFDFESDHSVKAVVLAANGKSFCAGGDVKAMREKSGMFSGQSDELMKNYQQGIQRIPLAMERFKKPLIAAVQGAAIGAGCDLACMCDIRIGGAHSKMGETFTKLGLVPGDGGTFFLSRIVGYAKAMEMFLTAKIYSPDECFEMGLLNKLVDKNEDVLESALGMAQDIAKNSTLAVQLTKSSLKASKNADLISQLEALSAFQGMAQRHDDHFKRLPKLSKE